jgi:ABC-type molybdenum transport system ATPase subunit/photorepair protein PhrA
LFTAIIGVMTRFPRNAALQQWAATAVWAIVKDNGRGKTAFMKATTTDEVTGKVTSMRVLKNVLTQFGSDSEATAQAVIGCVLSLAINSVSSQKIIADMAFPNLIMSVLAKHPTISFRGEFDNLREWLRDNSAHTEEYHLRSHLRSHSHAD